MAFSLWIKKKMALLGFMFVISEKKFTFKINVHSAYVLSLVDLIVLRLVIFTMHHCFKPDNMLKTENDHIYDSIMTYMKFNQRKYEDLFGQIWFTLFRFS